jgi:DNA-binding MltR family transcriptional regulator
MAAKTVVTSLLSGTSLLGDLAADLERAGAVGRRLDRVFCDLGKLAEIARRLVDA